MSLECMMTRDSFLEILSSVKNTIGNDSFPALNNIYLKVDASGDGVAMTSNGTDHTVRNFSAMVVTEGEVLLDAFLLVRLAATFTQGSITIKAHANGFGADVIHPKGEVEVLGMDPADFPQIASFQGQSMFLAGAEELRRAMDSVGFARSMKGGAAALEGIALIVKGGNATFTATDTKRIAKYTLDAAGASDIEVVIDPKSAKALTSMVGSVMVSVSPSGICFKSGSTEYQGRVYAKSFPAVAGFFSCTELASAKLPVALLEDTLNRINVLAKAAKATPHAKFIFRDSNELDIEFASTRGKIKKESMETAHQGPSMEITLNAELLHEALKKVTEEHVDLAFPATKANQTEPNSVILFPSGNTHYGVFNMAVIGA